MDFLAYFATVSVLPTWFLIMFLNWRIGVLKDRVEQLEAINAKLLQSKIEKLKQDLRDRNVI